MWKCIVCKKENQDNVLRCQCGFDRRLDYEHFRTFVKLDTQDIQNYHRMKTTAQEAITPKAETSKPVVNQPKVETSKPVVNQPKVETSKPAVNQSKVTPTKPVENKVAANKPSGTTQQVKASAVTPPPVSQAKTSSTVVKPSTVSNGTKQSTASTPTQTATTAKPSSSSTVVPKVTQPPVFLEKTIFPKTKLDWLVLVIGVVLLYKVIWPYNIESAHFFTSEYFFEPLSNFINSQNWNVVIYVTTISYLLMYKLLGTIQYKKRRWWIFLYPIFSLMPLCFFGDIVWGFIMYLMGDTVEMWTLASIDNLMASWFLLQIIIVILAFFEDPAKVVAKRKARKEKRKARKMSLFPQTKLQTLVLAMGIALAVIFANRENWYYAVIDIEDKMIWEMVLLFWILLYWLGKRLRYTYKFFKIVSYVYFSCLPIALISDVVWSSNLLRPYAGEHGTGWALTFVTSWVLVLIMSIKEEQIII